MHTLTPRQRRLLRKTDRALRAANERGPDSADGELNIVPFLDVVVNLVMFLLMTVTATLAMADVPVNTPPTRDGPRVAPSVAPTPAPAPSLPPLVHLDADGVHVFAAGQRQAPGCRAVGASAVTVPRVGGAQDWLALRSCALELAADAPDQRVRLSATADAPYEDIVHAMDALRGTPAQPLFSDVQWIAATR